MFFFYTAITRPYKFTHRTIKTTNKCMSAKKLRSSTSPSVFKYMYRQTDGLKAHLCSVGVVTLTVLVHV